MSSPKNILLIFTIPSIKQSAFQRLSGFAKYLSELGHKVHVLTTEENRHIAFGDKTISVHTLANKSILQHATFSSNDSILWHKSKAAYNILLSTFFPDLEKDWLKNAKRFSKKFIKEKNIEVIISSYAPLAPHFLAKCLKENNPSVKWIADMRDEIYRATGLSLLTRKRLEKIEKSIVDSADSVISVSKPILDDFKKICSNDNTVFKEIRNGYNFNIKENIPVKHGTEKFKIYFLGSFYGYITPGTFMKALERVVEKHKNIEVEFIGSNTSVSVPNTLKDYITKKEAVPYEEFVNKMYHADVLLLILPKTNRKGVYSGKIFEYLASGKTIIGVLDLEDVAAKIIEKANAGYCADSENINSIEDMIHKAYKDWKENKLLERNWDIVKAHHRKEQVKRLSDLIENITK